MVWFKTQKVCSDRQELVTMNNKFVNEFRNKVRVDAKKVVYCINDDDALCFLDAMRSAIQEY